MSNSQQIMNLQQQQNQQNSSILNNSVLLMNGTIKMLLPPKRYVPLSENLQKQYSAQLANEYLQKYKIQEENEMKQLQKTPEEQLVEQIDYVEIEPEQQHLKQYGNAKISQEVIIQTETQEDNQNSNISLKQQIEEQQKNVQIQTFNNNEDIQQMLIQDIEQPRKKYQIRKPAVQKQDSTQMEHDDGVSILNTTATFIMPKASIQKATRSPQNKSARQFEHSISFVNQSDFYTEEDDFSHSIVSPHQLTRQIVKKKQLKQSHFEENEKNDMDLNQLRQSSITRNKRQQQETVQKKVQIKTDEEIFQDILPKTHKHEQQRTERATTQRQFQFSERKPEVVEEDSYKDYQDEDGIVLQKSIQKTRSSIASPKKNVKQQEQDQQYNSTKYGQAKRKNNIDSYQSPSPQQRQETDRINNLRKQQQFDDDSDQELQLPVANQNEINEIRKRSPVNGKINNTNNYNNFTSKTYNYQPAKQQTKKISDNENAILKFLEK